MSPSTLNYDPPPTTPSTTSDPTTALLPAAATALTLRRARLRDLPLCAQIGTEAFATDIFFGHLIPSHLPNRLALLHTFIYYRTMRRFLDPRTAVMIAEVNGEPAGFVSWARFGAGGERILGSGKGQMGWGYVCHPVEQALRMMWLNITEWFTGIRPREVDSYEMAHYKALEAKTGKEVYSHWPERWHMQMLAVRPSMQCKGAGYMLSKWGIDRAEEEGNGVAVTCEASVKGFRVYKKLGFEQVDWWDRPVDVGTPVLAKVPGREMPYFEWDEFGVRKSNRAQEDSGVECEN